MTSTGQHHTAEALAEAIAQRCEHARQHGEGWMARCPAHDDRTPSLSITPKGDLVLLHCFANCTADAVMHAIGGTTADLFVTRPSNGHAILVDIYDYVDEAGSLLSQKLRYQPKRFVQRCPDPSNPGEYLSGHGCLQGVRKVLYNLPNVLAAKAAGAPIYLTEGEKDAKTLIALGLTATTNRDGAGKWDASDTATLAGAEVILLPDNDAAGQEHAALVAKKLKDQARGLCVVPVPAPYKDVTDWVEAGATRADLDALVQTQQAANTPTRPRFQTLSARALAAKILPPQELVIPGILPVGVILFTGRGKDGKSLLAWNLCLAVATGGKALGQYAVPQGDVLYLCLEDGERRAQKRLYEQMDHMGAEDVPDNLDLVLWDSPRIGEGFEDALLTWVDEHPHARLVVVDILEKVRPKRTRNGSVYADDYAALAPLQRIAQERGIGVLVVHHSNKTRPDDFRDSASGSMGLIAACDTFWSLQRIAGEADAALHIIGRDVDAAELALRFADGFWTVLGNAEDYRLSQASKAVLEALSLAGKPLTPKQLGTILNIPEGTLRSRLSRMAERGEILNLGDNRYIPRSSSSLHESEGGNAKSGATAATAATAATVVHREGHIEGSVALDSGKCNGGATVLSDGKDRDLGAVRCTVAGVAPLDALAGKPRTSESVALTCFICRSTEFWLNAGGEKKCSRCHPPHGGGACA